MKANKSCIVDMFMTKISENKKYKEIKWKYGKRNWIICVGIIGKKTSK